MEVKIQFFGKLKEPHAAREPRFDRPGTFDSNSFFLFCFIRHKQYCSAYVAVRQLLDWQYSSRLHSIVGIGSGSGRVRANNFHIFRAEFGFIFCLSRNVLRISLEEIGKSSVKCISRYPAYDDPNRHYCCHHPCIYIVCAFRNLVTRFVCSRYISKRISLI